jgi:hypothetical protein
MEVAVFTEDLVSVYMATRPGRLKSSLVIYVLVPSYVYIAA